MYVSIIRSKNVYEKKNFEFVFGVYEIQLI